MLRKGWQYALCQCCAKHQRLEVTWRLETPSTGSTHHGLSFKDTFGTQLWLKVSRLREFRWSKLLKLWSSKSTAGRLVGRLRNQQFWSGHLGSPRHLSSRTSSPIHLASCTTQAGGKLYYLLSPSWKPALHTWSCSGIANQKTTHHGAKFSGLHESCRLTLSRMCALWMHMLHVYMLYVYFNIIHIVLLHWYHWYIIDIHIFQCFNHLHTFEKKKTSESIWPQGGCPPGCTRCQAEARKPTRSTCQRVGSWGIPWSIAVPIDAPNCCCKSFFWAPLFFGRLDLFTISTLIRYQAPLPLTWYPPLNLAKWYQMQRLSVPRWDANVVKLRQTSICVAQLLARPKNCW